VFEELIALLPSWPDVPQPQHFTPPVPSAAQVLLSPAAIAATPDLSPVTDTGANEAVVVPLPNCRWSLLPQHLMPLAAVSTQVWLLPAASRAPDTGPDGTVVEVVDVEVVDVVLVDVVEVDADASCLRHFQICTSVSPRW